MGVSFYSPDLRDLRRLNLIKELEINHHAHCVAVYLTSRTDAVVIKRFRNCLAFYVGGVRYLVSSRDKTVIESKMSEVLQA